MLDNIIEDFMGIKQICVDESCHRMGYGSSLYNYIFGYKNLDIYLAIVAEPLNSASLNFNTKHNFVKVKGIIEKDGISRGIFYRSYITK